MAKTSGETRNYVNSRSVLYARRQDYNNHMNTGMYDKKKSKFDKSGGFLLYHIEHNDAKNKWNKDGNIDKADYASKILIKHGYRIEYSSEKSTIKNQKTNDGIIEGLKMDVKTINNVGANTIKGALEKASSQGVNAVVLVQTKKEMTRKYVETQLEKFKEMSPRKAVEKIKIVYVVGMKGSVHRHKL